MGMMNRRNAFLGWLVWEIGKRMMKRKAAAAVPSFDTETKRPNKSAVVVVAAFLAGLLWLWFRDGDEIDEALE